VVIYERVLCDGTGWGRHLWIDWGSVCGMELCSLAFTHTRRTMNSFAF
jgi:hypothetical protein